MKIKRLFNLFAVIIGVITCFSFNKVQASDMTSVFGMPLTRSNLSVMNSNTVFTTTTSETLKLIDSGYKYDGSKKVWKITNLDNVNNVYYCLNMNRGFSGMAENSTDEYTYKQQLTKSDLDNYSGITISNEIYNKILWILDNAYVPTNTSNIYYNDSYKVLMKNANIDIYSDNTYNLTEDDIVTAQRLAIWHYTNNFNATSSIEGIPDDDLKGIYGEVITKSRKGKLIDLYNYFIENADSNYTWQVPNIKLGETEVYIQEDNSSYIVGPYKLIGENISAIKSINITSEKDYILLDSRKNVVKNNNFSKVINNEFYLKFNKSQITQSTNIEMHIEYEYDKKTHIFMTNLSEVSSTQPVVIVHSENIPSSTIIEVPIELMSVSAEKIWNDNNNRDGKRPGNIEVQLYKDGKAYGNSVILNGSNLTYTWERLLSGYEYTVKELDSNGNEVNNGGKYNNNYTATYQVSNNKTTITNTYIPETIDISGTKTWSDQNNQDRLRPESITVNLLANGKEIKETTVTANNDWKYEFTNLHKYENGKEIRYTITEDKVENYTTTIDGYNIKNTYIPEVVEKTVTKIWEDGNDNDGIRPQSIQVQLFRNGITYGNSVTLNENNNWKYTWSTLPAKENGKQIVYTVEEVEVPEGYSVQYSEDTFTITNIHVSRDLAIQIQKVDELGKVITSSEAEFEILNTRKQTNNGILNLNSQKLNNNFEFLYTIKETKAPIGYNGISEDLTVKISGTTRLENGSYLIDTINITDKDGNALNNTKISAEYDATLNKVVIKIINTKITNGYSVKLLKVSQNGETPISGAWFKIDDGQATVISETGEEIATGTLSEAGELNLTYKLEETVAPDGYIKLEELINVNINAKVELKDEEYQITQVAIQEELDGVTVSEENNVITIKVENEIEVTGKYNIVLRKVDENGNILTGSKFEINGKEYDLSTGAATILEEMNITSVEDIDLTYDIKETTIPEGYEGIEDTTIYINAKVIKDGNSYKITRVNGTFDGDNAHENVPVTLEGNTIVISVKNNPIQKKLDLSLRKYITKINDIGYSRQPVVDTSTIATTGTATYRHTKQPIAVQKGDIITYTIRVYNEGEVDGYVDMITDHLPDNLLPIIDGVEGIDSEEYKEEIEFNSNWLWIYSDDGKTVTTTITSKSNSDSGTYSVLTGLEEVTDTKLDAYVEGSEELDYIDVQIKCLVTDNAVSGEYLTNIAEISKMCEVDGIEVETDRDSTKLNADYSNLANYKNEEAISSSTNSYIAGQEDDDDFEKVFVKEFDLALRKFITKVNETSYSRQPVVDTSKLGTTLDGKTITTATYTHSKEPVIVETGDLVTYKIRIYNEGTLDGFANEIIDDIPEGLEFLPNSSINVSYKWQMLDSEGNETTDVSKAVIIVTNYLSDIDKNNIIEAVSETDGVKTLSYKDVEVQFKVTAIAEKLQDNIIINEAQISEDSDRDIDSTPNRDEKYDYETGSNEDDIDYEPIKLQYFDLALRKFITKVNTTDYNNRYPEVIYEEDGSIKYQQTKDPVLVTTGNTVIYTIRVYNEGEKAGTATEITDNLPEGLEFLPDNDVNKSYGWKLIDQNGNETQNISEAKKVTTDILENEIIDGIIKGNGQKILSYKDVQIAFKVIEDNTSDKILVNTAEISEDTADDIDSTPDNQIETEDDLDKEYVKVQYFDLALKKWVTSTKVTYNGKTTTTKTGFTEDSEGIAKVDLVASKMKKTTVKFTYNIKVINEGELPGYAYEVKDYIPNGLKFVQEDNKDWKEIKDGVVVTDKLKDTLLNPGESATVEITLTWKNSTTNLALKTNYAEISEDSGDDIDSTPNNFNKQEDDIDDAQVILSIKTAGATTYVGLILTSVAILAAGIFLIKKYVIN